jgi:hypothetical protein
MALPEEIRSTKKQRHTLSMLSKQEGRGLKTPIEISEAD